MTSTCFANFVLDEPQRRLWRAGQPVHVQPKVFDFIVYLVQHRERVVTKAELREALWPGVVVTDAAMLKAVKLARRALGDSAQAQSIIRTVHAQGYQFVAPLKKPPPQKRRGKCPRIEPEDAYRLALKEAEACACREPQRARALYRHALDSRTLHHDWDLFAQGVLGAVGVYLRFRPADAAVISELRQAIACIPKTAHAARAQLWARLAAECSLEPDWAERYQFRQNAMMELQRSKSARALVAVLGCSFAQVNELVPPASRLGLLLQAVDEACRAHDARLELGTRLLLLEEMLGLGELGAFDDELPNVEALALSQNDEASRYVVLLRRVARALLAGAYAEAETCIEAAYALGRQLTGLEVLDIYYAQRIVLLVLRNDANEALARYGRIYQETGNVSAQCLRMWMLAHAGELATAKAALREFMNAYGARLAAMPTATGNLTVLASVCARVGCQEHASTLYEHLAPLSGRNALRGRYAALGPVDAYLAELATLQGHTAVAARHQCGAAALLRQGSTSRPS